MWAAGCTARCEGAAWCRAQHPDTALAAPALPICTAGSCPYGSRCHYNHAQLSAATREALLELHQEEQRKAREAQEAERAQQEAQRREVQQLLTPLSEELLVVYALKLA